MTESEFLSLLKDAYQAARSFDWDGYFSRMARARTALKAMPENRPLAGELILLSSLPELIHPRMLPPIYRKALSLIGGRSQVIPPQAPMLLDYYSPFCVCHREPGQAEREADAFDEAEDLYRQLTGGGAGTALLFRAQLCHARGELSRMEALAKEAFELAVGKGQQMTALCAAELRAQLAKFGFAPSIWQHAMLYIRRVASGELPADPPCRERAQLVRAGACLSLGLLYEIPQQVRTGDFGALPVRTGGYRTVGGKLHPYNLPGALIVRIQYLACSGQPDRALLCAALAEQVLGISGMPCYSIYLEMLRAGCHHLLGEREQAAASIARALEAAAPDRLWLIPAEFLPSLEEPLLREAARCGGEAAREIRRLGSGHRERLRSLREAADPWGLPRALSPREREVACLAAHGLSDAQIAQRLGIGRSTVKTHLLNVYSKLNIDRRSKIRDLLEEPPQGLAAWLK